MRCVVGVPEALPSLIKAYRIQDKARNVGFDWKDKSDVWAKVREELGELEVELKKKKEDKRIPPRNWVTFCSASSMRHVLSPES